MAVAVGRRSTWRRCAPAVAAVVLVASSCAEGTVATPTVVVPETVSIGGMPGPLAGASAPTLPELGGTTTTTQVERSRITGPLAREVLGNRVLLIGDTALAATTPRAGGLMCDIVTGFGWDVAIEAEPGRSLAFAEEVMDELLDDEWDVVALMFGHHVDATVVEFEQLLDELLDRLEPRPVVLVTVAELGEEQAEINAALRARQRSRPNVVILDWADATAAEPDVLLDDGGPVPSVEGAGRLALFTAALLSRFPGDDAGACLEPTFTDDSAIVL